MELSNNFWGQRSVVIKFCGAVALAFYFITSHFTFDPLWFLMSMMVSFGAFLLYILTVVTFNGDNKSEAFNEQQQFVKSKNTWNSYLVAMEDGVFLLPLLFVGITPLTVGIATILFGVFNCSNSSKVFCAVQMLAYFIVGLWVLPYGIWPVVAAHIIVGTLVTYNLSSWLDLNDNAVKNH